MDRQRIIDIANDAIATEFELDAASFTPETRLHDDLHLDSLDYVDLVIVLEQAFSFKIHNKQDLVNIRTMADIYDFIETVRDGAQASGA